MIPIIINNEEWIIWDVYNLLIPTDSPATITLKNVFPSIEEIIVNITFSKPELDKPYVEWNSQSLNKIDLCFTGWKSVLSQYTNESVILRKFSNYELAFLMHNLYCNGINNFLFQFLRKEIKG